MVRDRTLGLGRPLVAGILNATPDSFSDGGGIPDVASGIARARAMVRDGADLLDVGGESTRPGARRVPEGEEIARVVPLIRAIAEGLPGVPISVDTVRSRVARAALDAGAHIINDVSGFRLDPDMACVCAMADAGVVLMHSRGDVERMASYDQASYEGDVVEVVRSELQKGLDAAFAAGVDPARVAVDPGIGFSKRSEHSLRLLANLHRIRRAPR
jgi:dihydropteroate synthase